MPAPSGWLVRVQHTLAPESGSNPEFTPNYEEIPVAVRRPGKGKDAPAAERTVTPRNGPVEIRLP